MTTDTVFLGDCNFDVRSKDYKKFLKLCRLKNSAVDRFQPTIWDNVDVDANNGQLFDVIDFILSNMECKSKVLWDCKISDHFPLMGYVSI